MERKDYNLIFNEFALKSLNGEKKMRLLLHTCCVPCLLGCIERVVPYFDVTLLFYNPNIDTKQEYELRLSQLDKIKDAFSLDSIAAIDYDHAEFLRASSGLEGEAEGGKRCRSCFDLRLNFAANYATAKDFNAFATTLTLSPHKNAALINEIGLSAAKSLCNKAVYISSDFKKQEGVKRSGEFCRQFDIYRQSYCGCNFLK